MRRHERRTIHVVSHGPSCLDGVMAAATIKRFYADERVLTTLAANGDSDRVIQGLRLKPGSQPDEIWVTDLSWTSTETAAHLRQLLRGGTLAYWIHQVPESPDWALAVQTLGGMESYREIARLSEPVMSRRLRAALEEGRLAMDRSLALANATMVERSLGNGLRVRTACCLGYSSEVASKLYEGQSQTGIALFDLRSLGVSLSRSAECKGRLLQLARHFGGAGHPAAAGFMVEDAKRAPAERLAHLLRARLSPAS